MYTKGVIVGLLLSDGWLIIPTKRSKNARFGFKQSLSRSVYVWFVFNILSHYCSRFPQLTKSIRLGNKHYGLEFFTRSLPCLTELHSLFYPEGIKIVPRNIYELLTSVSLAQIIMGDGYASRHGLILCTDSYCIEDIVRLMNVLMIRYRFECTLRYHTPTQLRIYIKEGSMSLLKQIVKPHMCPSMLYKINL